ncbi:MAG: ribonuclease P protein component [Treponema sp.]|nr:ribonuclease P protein component [Treponema sp.]
MRRQEHLKRRVTITGVFKKGRVVRCSGIKLFFLTNGLACNRFVITFVRKYGNAVRRNRARRLVRESYRLMKGELETGYDLVLLLHPEGVPQSGPQETIKRANRPKGSLAESTGQLRTLFTKAGIHRRV